MHAVETGQHEERRAVDAGRELKAEFRVGVRVLFGLQIDDQKAEQERIWSEKVAAAEAAGEPLPKKPRRKDPTNPRNFKAAVPGALVLCPTRELAQQVGKSQPV